MNEDRNLKQNYNNTGERQFENTFGQQAYMPNNYDYNRGYTDSFYDEYQESSSGSFLLGALVGGIIGAAAALFLAPKTGKEMREDFSTQAGQLREKSIEISSVAKDKATEYTSVAKEKATEYTSVAKEKATEISAVAKEKTGEMTKTIQEQSGQLVEKVKTMTSKTSVPMDDGTTSSEGEEATEFIKPVATNVKDELDADKDIETSTAEAFKEAVVKTQS